MAAVVDKNQSKNTKRRNRQRNRSVKKSETDGAPTSEVVSPTEKANGLQKNEPSASEEGTEERKEDNEEAKVCLICAEPVKYYSVSECNHRTCHVCALRLRVLYKKMECTLCKHPQEHVIFTVSPDKPYSEYDVENMPFKDAKQHILFETQEMMEETMILLRFNCPDNDCAFIGRNWNDLKAHVRSVHSKLMCDLCIRHKKVFAHEHALYTHAQLLIHLPSMGHRLTKQTSNEKMEGGIHPLCEFCRECLFSDDELFTHMRDRHEECFVCKRQGVRDQYFKDYNSLEQHFTQGHFPCIQPTCREQKFVVFGSSMDLQAHMVEVHGSTMSTRDRKDARRVVADFEFEEARAGNRRRDREGTTARGREQEQEPPPASQTQGRTGGTNRRREGFGAALTSDEPSGSGTNTPAARQSRHPSPSPTREPIDPATAQAHAAFLSRLASLTNNSSSATASVRSAIRSYRGSESAARDLILTIYNVLDSDLDATSGLISLLVDLLDEEKRRNLLEFWNGFKIEHRAEFPELTHATGDNVYAGVASGRVLTAKSSTTRSSQQSRRQVWDRVARAASNSNVAAPSSAGPSSIADRFPALPAQRITSSTPAPTPSYRQAPRMTPWASSSSTAPAPRSEPQRITNRKNTAAPVLSDTSFPSLPTASARTLPPMSGNQSLRKIIGGPGPSVNPWTPTDTAVAGDTVEDNNTENPGRKGKKKKGKEKVTLFTLGTFPA